MATTRGVHDFDIPNGILKGAALRRHVNDRAEEIADKVRGQGVMVEGEPGDIPLPVRVDSYTTDRARATVWLAHPSALAVQAKHGALLRAASAAGLSVKGD